MWLDWVRCEFDRYKRGGIYLYVDESKLPCEIKKSPFIKLIIT